jgi:hypothetical protein
MWISAKCFESTWKERTTFPGQIKKRVLRGCPTEPGLQDDMWRAEIGCGEML